MDGSSPYSIEEHSWLLGFIAGIFLAVEMFIVKLRHPAWSTKYRMKQLKQILAGKHPLVITFHPEFKIEEPLSLIEIPGWTFLNGEIHDGGNRLVGLYESNDRVIFGWIKNLPVL